MALKNTTPINVKEALENINKGDIRPVYLIYGEDESQINEYAGALLDAILPKEYRDGNYLESPFEIKTFKDNRDFLDTMPFLAPRRVILFTDCPFIQLRKKLTKDMEDVLEELKGIIEQPDPTCILIFIFESDDEKRRWIDKRSSFFKFVQKNGIAIETGSGFKLGTLINIIASKDISESIRIFDTLFENTASQHREKLCTSISKRLRDTMRVILANQEMPKSWFYDNEQKDALAKFRKNFSYNQLVSAYERLMEVEDLVRIRKNTELVSIDLPDVVKKWMLQNIV